MALLTQAAYNVQLAPVMTSTNWKRPWIDVDEAQQRPASQASLPSPQQSLSASTLRQGHDTAGSTRVWRPDPRSDAFPSSNSSSQSQSTPHAPDASHTRYPAYDAYTPSKRPRLEGSEPMSPYGSREEATVDRKPVLGRSEPYAMPPITSRAEKEMVESRKHNAMSPVELLSSREPRATDSSGMTEPPQTKDTGIVRPKSAECSTCRHASSMAPRIVQGLAKLHTDLSTMWSSNPQIPAEKESSTSQEKRTSILPNGILDSLDWSLEKLNESIDLARGMLGSRRAQDQDHSYSRTLDRTSSQGSILDKQEKWDEMSSASRHPRRSPPGSDDSMRHPDTLPPMFSNDDRRRRPPPSISTQQSPQHSYQGHHIPQSPAHHQPPRSSFPPLPSPSSLSFTGTPTSQLPPMSPSLISNPRSTPASSISGAPPKPSRDPSFALNTHSYPPTTGPPLSSIPQPRSPHTTHLADLQHALSTKTLAHTVLQQEHDKLLSAYSRLQTRYGALEKKTAVSDQEINGLVEERIRLSGALELAEGMVEELRERGEEREREVGGEREQWGRILERAGRLERMALERVHGERAEGGDGVGTESVRRMGVAVETGEGEGDGRKEAGEVAPAVRPGTEESGSGVMATDAPADVIKLEDGTGPIRTGVPDGLGASSGPKFGSASLVDSRLRDELTAWRDRAERAERVIGRYQAQALQVRNAVSMLEGIGRGEGVPVEG